MDQEEVMDLLTRYSDEDEPKVPKKKDPGFDVKQKIKELMAKSSSPSNNNTTKISVKHLTKKKPYLKEHFSRRKDSINKGVSHGIKRPKFSKAKEKQENRAKGIVRRIKEVRSPPRLPSNRSPLKPGAKPKWHKLSSPGTSLLDSPDSSSYENSPIQSPKFFTSRSRAAAVVKINNALKLSSRNGEITINQRKGNFEKKNIGRAIELELEKRIAAATLQSPITLKKLENIAPLSSVSNRSTPKLTRFPSSPSPKKQIPVQNGTPKRKTSPLKTSNPISNTPTRRTSPRKQLLKTMNESTPSTSPRGSPYSKRSAKKEQVNGNTILTQSPSTKSPNIGHQQTISPRKRKSLLHSLEFTEEDDQRNGRLEEDKENSVLEDMESAFEQIESNTEEDEILSSILMENQSPNKEDSSLRRSPRKKNSPNKQSLSSQSLTSDKSEDSFKTPNEKVRYFPVFEPRKNVTPLLPKSNKLSTNQSTLQKKKFITKKLDQNQMIIDAGQKEFGATFCKDCGTLYEVGNPEDEENHMKAHAFVSSALKFSGWKNERQVTHMDRFGGRVLKVLNSDYSQWWKKIKEVLQVVDDDLGFSESSIRCLSTTTAFLYILEKQIAGVLIVESIEKAYRVIQEESASNNDESNSKLICCSETPVNVSFGISRIWVLATHRQKGIATKLVDAMRSNLLSYHFLTVDQFAFSDPTQSGMAFAEKYTQKADFLVYRRE